MQAKQRRARTNLLLKLCCVEMQDSFAEDAVTESPSQTAEKNDDLKNVLFDIEEEAVDEGHAHEPPKHPRRHRGPVGQRELQL